MAEKLIIAHRGAAAEAPENTLGALQKAIDCGADMAEVDVRRTKDGRLVLAHDPAVQGQTIRKLTLRELEAAESGIPTLEQALKLCQGKIRLDIELKEKGLEQEAVDLADKYLSPGEFIFSSYKEDILAGIMRYSPNCPCGLIVGSGEPGKVLRLVFRPKRLEKYRYLILHKNWLKLKIHLLYPSATKLWVWTLDREREIKQALLDSRVGGVITNRPAAALNLRALHI